MGGGEPWARAYFADAPDGALVVEVGSGRVVAANRRANELAGRSLLGLDVGEVGLEALATREGIGEHSFVRPDGTVIGLESNVRRVDGLMLCGLRSLAPAEPARRAAIESEARLRALMDATQQVMLLAGLDRRVQAFNAVADQWARAVLDEPLQRGTRLDLLLEPVVGDLFERSWARAIAGERALAVAGLPGVDGNVEWFESIYGPVTAGGEIVGVAITADRITERKNAEDALRESERRLELALEGADLGLWDMRLDLGTMQFNDRAASMLGHAREDLGTTTAWWSERIHPDDRENARAAFDAHVAGASPRFESEMRIETASGTHRWILSRGKVTERDDQGQPVRVSGTLIDVEERKILESRLHRAERLEALGRLAGGIAHDFNNLLTAILGNLATLHPTDPMQREARDEIELAATRAAGLTRQLLAFGRRQPLAVQAIDPLETLQPMEALLGRLLPENIELQTAWREPGWVVEADPVQLDQVLLNLVLNARDAMSGGGVLRIRLTDTVVTTEQAHRHGGTPGDHVLLEVADTGVGIDPDVLPRIFDPFFTTKELGQGTGLGLATVYGVVTQHGGMVECASAPGRGTTLRVYLPRARRAAAPPPAQPAPSTYRGTETLLVTEDEASVRRILCRVLEDAGYEVLEASDPADALRLLDEGHSPDMLVTDVVMPGMSGTDLATEVRRRIPSMPVLVISGYSEHAVSPTENVLTKPFPPEELLRRVRQLLDRRAGEEPGPG